MSVSARWAASTASCRVLSLPKSTPSESTISALRPVCFLMTSYAARTTAS